MFCSNARRCKTSTCWPAKCSVEYGGIIICSRALSPTWHVQFQRRDARILSPVFPGWVESTLDEYWPLALDHWWGTIICPNQPAFGLIRDWLNTDFFWSKPYHSPFFSRTSGGNHRFFSFTMFWLWVKTLAPIWYPQNRWRMDVFSPKYRNSYVEIYPLVI